MAFVNVSFKTKFFNSGNKWGLFVQKFLLFAQIEKYISRIEQQQRRNVILYSDKIVFELGIKTSTLRQNLW